MGKKATMVWGVLWAMLFAVGPVFGAPVPDTGVTKCYDDAGNVITCPSPGQRFYGQDANYTINPPSYTRLDSSGNALAVSATSWVMVRDNVTGLIWEVKTDEGSIHDKDNTYTWYDPSDPYPGTPGEGTDTDDFLDALNDARFGGFNDWRLPTIKELAYLVDYSIPKPGPTINTTYFPKTVSSYYWSSTTDAYSTSHASFVYFYYGEVSGRNKSNHYYVRAVRGGQSFNTFVDNGNGTVTDTSTGLMWQQDTARDDQGNYDLMTWEEALAYCESRTLGAHTDWRLPTIKELRSLADYTRSNPTINTAYFPNTVSSGYWSSTNYAYDKYYAWNVYFNYGHDGLSSKPCSHYVRAVRGGPGGSFDNYPYKDFDCPDCTGVCCHLPDKGGDPWGFCIKNCTSYVAFRLNNALGEGKFTNTMDGGRWGNGANWDNNVKNVKGFELVTQPDAGDVAQWDNVACYDEDGKTVCYGHVAYVEKVNSDGTILVSEYNWSNACAYGQRTISAGAPSNFIRANLTPAVTVDYAKIDDGAAVTQRTELTENVDLAPSGNIFVKIWNWVKGLIVGTDNTESSAARNMNESAGSSATFEFGNPVTEVIAYIADFGGRTTFAAYNNDQVLKTINIASSTPEYYTISNVGAITKVVVTSTSGWVGPVTTTMEFYVNASGSCGDKKPCYTTIQAALNVVGDGAVIKIAQGQYPESPIWTKSGTVTISGGWKTDFSGQDGTTSMYAPRATGGGGVKIQPSVKIIPKP